jgi:hypothetical protein
MLRGAASLVVGGAIAVLVSATLLAIKYGQLDNLEHPYVGLVVFYDAGGVPQWRCTGTLLSPTVLLTAAHCTELDQGAQVWFDENVVLGGSDDPDNDPLNPCDGTWVGYPCTGGHEGDALTNPDWQGGLFLPNTNDYGVVLLDTPVDAADLFVDEFPTLPTLAPVGFLDALAKARGTKDVNFEVVGYGLQSVKPELSAFRFRLKAWVQLINLRSALTDGYNIQTTNSPGKGTGPGGTCFGDSGGAIFRVEANGDHKIVGINSFVLNPNCAGSAFGYRVDRQPVQDWINGFLP